MADNASLLRGTGNQASLLRGSGAPNAFRDFWQQAGGRGLDILESLGGPSYAVEKEDDEWRPAKSGTFREQADLPEQTDTLAGKMGAGFAEAAAIAVPVGGVASGISRAASKAPAALRAVQNMLSGYGVAFRAAPVATTAVEATLGATAALGGYTAQEMYPESETAQFIGEILGGAGPGAVTAGAKGVASLASQYSGMGWIGRKMADTWKHIQPANALKRASGRTGRATADVDKAIAQMGEDLLPGLTPAARTGDKGLLALEKSVDSALDDADKFLGDSIDTVNTNLKNAIEGFRGSPDATTETYLKAQGDLGEWLEGNIQLAAQRTERALAKLSPRSPRETVNRVAAQELRGALETARTQERALYELIPMKAVVPTNSAKSTFRNLLAQTSKAEMDDIPSVAKTFLAADSGQKFGAQSTIKEMRGLQSKLRQVARNARSGDNASLNKARIADMIADSITDDIALTEGGEEVAGLVQAAVSYSRDLNGKFRKGTVGTLLGFAKQGEARVPEGLVLESSIGLRGPRAREAFDDIIKATNSPEVNAAMEDFVKNQFVDEVVRDGAINRSAAESFMRKNKEVLGRLPGVSGDLAKAMQSLDVQDLRMAQKGRVSFDKPAVSRATMFIEKGPDRAFNDVLGSRNPRREMSNLVNMANRDATGEALNGLKSAFSDYVKKNAMSGDFISGGKLDTYLSDPKTRQAMKKLYSAPEMRRWDVIQNTAKKLDLQRKARPSGEGVLGDEPGKTVTVLARLLGARSGTSIAGKTGIGGIQAQAIMSERFKDLLAKGMDPGRELVMKAVQDEKLFKEVLLAEIAPDGKIPEQARRRLNAWLATVFGEEE